MKEIKYNFISKNRRPIEDKRFVTGHGKFVGDIERKNMLHVSVLASHEPSASIDEIDYSNALKVEGVVDIITGKELANAILKTTRKAKSPNYKKYLNKYGDKFILNEYKKIFKIYS